MLSKKKTFRIIAIILTTIVGVVAVIYILLTLYIKKQIVSEFEKNLNAKIKIQHVDFNLFNGYFFIKNFELTDLNDSLLLSCRKFKIKLENLSLSNTSKIDIKKIEISDINIFLSIQNYGTNNFNNILKKFESGKTNISESPDLSINLSELKINNLNFYHASSDNNFNINNLDFSFNKISKTDTLFNYSFAGNLTSENLSEKFSGKGIFTISNNYFTTTTNAYFNDIPINFYLFFNISDSVPEKFHITAFSDLSKYVHEYYKTSGVISVLIQKKGNFKNFNDLSINLTFSDVNILNSKTNKNLNFNASVQILNTPNSFNFVISEMEFNSNEEKLAGNFNFSHQNDNLIFNNSINGKITHKSFEKVFKKFPVEIYLNSDSNLTGEIIEVKNSLQGKTIVSLLIKFKNTTIEVPYFKANSNNLTAEIKINNPYISAKLNYESPYITRLQDKNVFVNKIIINVDSLNLSPNFNQQSEVKSPNIVKNTSGYDDYFTKYSQTILDCNLRNIKVNDLTIKSISFITEFSPFLWAIKDLKLNTINSNLNFSFYNIKNSDKEITQKLTLNTKDFNLSNLFMNNKDIKAIISVNSNLITNKILNDTIVYKTNGTIYFKIDSLIFYWDKLKEFEIPEKEIFIPKFEFSSIINNNLMKITPNHFYFNKASVRYSGEYNLSTQNIILNLLLDIPKEYLSNKLKILLKAMSEKSEKLNNLKSETNRKIILIKINGTLNNPELKIYE